MVLATIINEQANHNPGRNRVISFFAVQNNDLAIKKKP